MTDPGPGPGRDPVHNLYWTPGLGPGSRARVSGSGTGPGPGRVTGDNQVGHSYNVVVFMAAQPSKDGRLGGSPQNSYAGRLLSKRFVQGIAAFHQFPIPPEVGELMVNTQQYNSHERRFRQVSPECFIVDCSTPCLRGVGGRHGRVRKTQRYFPWRTVV